MHAVTQAKGTFTENIAALVLPLAGLASEALCSKVTGHNQKKHHNTTRLHTTVPTSEGNIQRQHPTKQTTSRQRRKSIQL